MEADRGQVGSSLPIVEGLHRNRIEIGGIEVKCIASNIRRAGLPWQSYELIPGVGFEGNLVVVEATSSTGFRTEVEGQSGRDERIYEGDRFVGVLGNRHSGTSESGDVPLQGIDIHPRQQLHLLAAGGIVGIKSGVPQRGTELMTLRPLGLVAQHGVPLDLVTLTGGHHESLGPSAPIILISGTSAEVGKTTTSVGLIRALKREGLKVGGVKFTGTGRMRDILSLRDAGASPWFDFPDVGLATTYTTKEHFTRGAYTLFNRVNAGWPDIIVAEAGGDPIEANVPTFLENPAFMNYVKAMVVVAGDVMGMMGTVSYLRKYNAEIPIFLTDPKGRNAVTTRERVSHELPGMTIFNSLNPVEVQKIAQQILAM